MILANWPRRASEEPHSSTAPNRLVEAYFLPWSVSLSSDAPYWRPPSRDAQYGLSVGVMVSKPVSTEFGAPLSKTRHWGRCALTRATMFIGSETAISPVAEVR